MKPFTLLFLLALLTSSASFAQCYSQVEAEADQGIRIHSELMVIGLNCQSIGARHGLDIYGDYKRFTARHADLLGKYEQILMNFYTRNGQSAKASLNILRTGYANTISNKAAQIRPDIFCARHAQRIEQARAMNEQDVRKWASTIYESHPVSYPLCR